MRAGKHGTQSNRRANGLTGCSPGFAQCNLKTATKHRAAVGPRLGSSGSIELQEITHGTRPGVLALGNDFKPSVKNENEHKSELQFLSLRGKQQIIDTKTDGVVFEKGGEEPAKRRQHLRCDATPVHLAMRAAPPMSCLEAGVDEAVGSGANLVLVDDTSEQLTSSDSHNVFTLQDIRI